MRLLMITIISFIFLNSFYLKKSVGQNIKSQEKIQDSIDYIAKKLLYTWVYNGRYLNNQFVDDTVLNILDPPEYRKVEVLTSDGLFEIKNNQKEKLNKIVTLSFVSFSETDRHGEMCDFEFDLTSNKFLWYDDVSFFQIEFKDNKFLIHGTSHFLGHEWDTPIVLINDDTLILLENGYEKRYKKFYETFKW